MCLDRRDDFAGIPDTTCCAGVLDERTEALGQLRVRPQGCEVELNKLNPDSLRAVREQSFGLGKGVCVDDEDVRLHPGSTASKQHSLDGRGALIEHGRIRCGHAGQVGNHGLEVDERLKATLRDFGLVWRVRRVPTGVLEHVALDHGGRDRVVVAKTNHAAANLVCPSKGTQFGERLTL
jgi:hypothetical protein